MEDARPRVYRFGPFRLDRRSRELREGSGPAVALTAKSFDTLCVLLDNCERVMGKDELLAAVWPGRVVEENNLSQAISALRRALGTEASDHRYLVTVPGRGYRFVADVRVGDEDQAVAALPPAAAGTATASMPPSVDSAAPDVGSAHGPRRAIVLGAVLFALALFAIVAWRMRETDALPATTAGVGATLAVLPFRSLSNGPRDELLELGLADTLATRLARSRDLRVRSLASAQRLAARQPDALAVARQLAASYVVDGSTQRIGDRVRVNVRLQSADGGGTLLARTFDTDIDRVFTLQDEIGDAVTSALSLRPVATAAHAASPCEGGDPQAFRALLRARYRLHRRDLSTIAAFQQAIGRDPSCAAAYAGLATAYMFMAHNDSAPEEVFPLARGAALQALRLDPRSADAHAAYGRYLQLYAWDWRGSEQALRHAIALNPSSAEAHFGLAHLLVSTGRFEEGLAQARLAREQDPLSPLINALEGGFLGAAGQPGAADKRLGRALELEPGFWIALQLRGGLALDRGDRVAALRDLQVAAVQSHRNSQTLAVLAIAQVAAGQRPQAETLLREMQARAAGGYIPSTSLASVYNALGDTDAALDALERGYAAHDIRIGFIKVDARWNNLRGQPRFEALMRKLGLPEAPAHGRY